MLQVSNMDGAVILTFSEPYSQSEKRLLERAKEVDRENSRNTDNPVGAGGIRWGDCSKAKKSQRDGTSSQEDHSPKTEEQAIFNQQLDELNRAFNTGLTAEEQNMTLEELGFEEILLADDIPF